MTQLILWTIMAYGLSNIVVYSKIFNKPRNFIKKLSETEIIIIKSIGEFLQGATSCMMCFGFHSGWFLSLLVYSPVHELLGANQHYSWLFDGMLASGAVWAVNSIIEWFESKK